MDENSPTRISESAPTIRGGEWRVEPGAWIGPYRILEVIGEGGFGTVYLADQREPVRRKVALKVLKPGMDTAEVIARFEGERQALAMMDHPGVAKVFDAGATPQGRPYFVMEYVQGVPITTYCDNSKLGTVERLGLFVQVCRAVQHAHQKGVIHRDLKPSNLLVTLVDGKPVPKVIDFGIAKAMTQPLSGATVHTQAGRILGTLEYMSPEQAGSDGLDVDTRADVYSLGVLLYELLTGSLPFDPHAMRQAGRDAIRRMILEVEPPTPSTRLSQIRETPTGRVMEPSTAEDIARRRRTDFQSLRRQVRGELDWITMKALEKDRTRRYDSPTGLAQDIERFLRNEPVTAGPPRAAYKVRKFIRRHRAGVAAGAAFAVVVGVALADGVYLYRRSEVQRGLAQTEAQKARAALSLVSGMFSSTDPSKAKGKEITVREVLDDEALKLDKSPGDQPVVDAAVHSTLGQAYHQLGQPVPAEKHLRKSYELRRSALGEDDPDTLEALANLGASLVSGGRFGEAKDVLSTALDGRRRTLGAEHSDTLSTLSLYGFAQQNAGDLKGALGTIRQVVALQEKTLGPNSHDTLESRNSLSDILQDLGQLEEAESDAKETASRALKTFGELDPLTLEALSIRASVLKDMGKLEESEQILRQVVASKTRVFGPDHLQTLLSLNALEQTLSEQKKMEEAETLARQLVESARRGLGAEHPSTLSYLNNLAQLLQQRKKTDEAAPLYREVVDLSRRVNGETGRQTLIYETNLGLSLLDAGKAAEALPMLETVTAGFEKTLPKDHWMVGACSTYVGDCLRALKRNDESEQKLLAGYALMTKSLAADNPRCREAAALIVKLYEEWGKPEKASDWKGRAGPPK